MKILIGCERSGVMRRAFEAKGHDATSCDLEPSLDGGKHIVADVVDLAYSGEYDMMIAHPPCRYLSYAGARWWKRPLWKDEQQKALLLFAVLLAAPINQICIENPRGLPGRLIRKPDDVIEPYEFGEPYKKRTYLWLKNLPPLIKTHTLTHYEVNWTERVNGFQRAVTFAGIAAAMAAQYV